MTKYQRFVIDSVPQSPASGAFALHAAIGLATEAAEFLQQYRKGDFQGTSEAKSKEALISELGDVYFYLTMAMLAVGTDEHEVIEANKAKLLARRNNIK